MKFKSWKFIFFGVLGAIGITTPSFLTSCSSIQTTKLKSLDLSSWGTDGKNTTYSSLKYSDVSIKDAIYGSNYNDGNYIFVYGWTGNPEGQAVADFLYGTNGNDGTGNIKVDMESTLNFSNSSFFKTFFTNGQGIGNSLYNFNVNVLMYIDYAPYNPNASSVNGLSGSESPTAKYSQEEVLAELNVDGDTYNMENLPDEAKAKIGTYKRNDKSAITYREIIKYLKEIRPNITTDDKGGIIAFSKDKNPKSLSLSSDANATLRDYYKPQ